MLGVGFGTENSPRMVEMAVLAAAAVCPGMSAPVVPELRTAPPGESSAAVAAPPEASPDVDVVTGGRPSHADSLSRTLSHMTSAKSSMPDGMGWLLAFS
jgi:hypothetical protein